MNVHKNVMEKVLEDKLKELSVRIIKDDPIEGYAPKGSGILYLTDDLNGFILTARHTMKDFNASDRVYLECYPDAADQGKKFPEDYMFSVKLEDVWKLDKAADYTEYDVAVIPLSAAKNPIRPWMKDRCKASFIPEKENLCGIQGIGYGYPAFTHKNDCAAACTELNKFICCDLHTKQNHSVKWQCEEKMSHDERHGLSGSLVAMHDAVTVVLTSVVQRTYADNDGKVINGTDLHWIRRLLTDKTDNKVPIREADPIEEKQTRSYLDRIETYLKKDSEESLLCTAQGTDLRGDIKDRYKNILEKVFGFSLSDLHNGKLHCLDYSCAKKQTAIRIAPSASRNEIENTLNSYHMEHRYPHMMLMAVTEDAQSAVIPDIPGHECLSKQHIWDIPRLIREIAKLPSDRIKDIFLYLSNQHTSVQGTEKPTLLFPSVPNNSDHFIPRSRDQDIVCLIKELKKQLSNPKVFISGVGGIGKTETAIQLAAYLKPSKGAYYLRYMEPLRNADGTVKEEGMRRTILHAEIHGHTRDGRTDDEEYQYRMDLLRKEYPGALLVIDNFDAHGLNFGDLRSEKSYCALTTIGIQVVFTTRYDLANAPGRRIEKISEDNLLALMRKHNPHNHATEEELKNLMALVGYHTLAVILIAKTLNKGNGMITAAHIQDLLTKGPDPSIVFPEVESDQNSSYKKDTLFDHLRKLLTPAYLDPEEKEVLKELAELPDEGEDLYVFIRNLTKNNAMRRNDSFNTLCDKGWAHVNREKRRVKMNPLLRCICKYELARESETPQIGCGAHQVQEVRT